MTVRFQNSSTSTHAAPYDLQLIDAGRRSSAPIADSPGCKTFARKDFSGGQVFRPVGGCFRVGDSAPPFFLHLSPDVGAVFCPTDITLLPAPALVPPHDGWRL